MGIALFVLFCAVVDVILGVAWMITKTTPRCPACAHPVTKGRPGCTACGYDFRPQQRYYNPPMQT